MIFNKKGVELTFEVIIVVAILLVTLVLILVFAGGGFKKLFGGIDERIGSLDDFDGDKVANFQDKCPCTIMGVNEEDSLSGCPKGTTPEQAAADQKKFKDNKCA